MSLLTHILSKFSPRKKQTFNTLFLFENIIDALYDI